MSAHLHMPHPHIAERFAAAFEYALHHRPESVAPQRAVPAAEDWNDWHYDPDDGREFPGRSDVR